MVDLARFFAPRRVALIGATEDLAKFGGRCMRQLIDFGYRGEIYPINPRRESIFDLRCYPSIDAVPAVPDHVGIVLSAAQVIGAVEACAAQGVPFATVFSSGFGEAGTADGHALQARLVSTARARGIRVMGPNCNGAINFVDGFALTSTATIRGPRQPAGDIAIASQSGGAGQVNIMWRAQQAGLRIGYQVSCGNDADLDVVDFAAFMLERDATQVVLILGEQIADGIKLRALARRATALDKSIVMVKVGRTAPGRRAAAAHTGSVAGEDAVFEGVLDQLGILRVDDCDELYQAAMLLRRKRWPAGRRVAATSISGGNLVMLADLAAAHGLEWPGYTADTQARLRDALPEFTATVNPTDLTAAAIGHDDAPARIARTVLDDANVDVLVPILTMCPGVEAQSIAQVSAQAEKPVAILWVGATTDDPSVTPASLVAAGHAVYRDPLPCVKAIDALARVAAHRRRRGDDDPTRPRDIDADAARRLLDGFTGVPSDPQIAALLACYGVRCGAAASALESAPLIEGLLVRIGRDASFGVVISVRLAGRLAAVFDDRSYRLPPISRAHATAMVAALRAYPLIADAARKSSLDLAALEDCSVRMSWLAADWGDRIEELEINVMPNAGGAVCVRPIAATVHAGNRQ